MNNGGREAGGEAEIDILNEKKIFTALKCFLIVELTKRNFNKLFFNVIFFC